MLNEFEEDTDRSELVQITSIEQERRAKYRYHLYVNGEKDEPFMTVHEDIMIKYRLLKGREIHPEELKEIVEADTKHKAYALGIAYIGIKPRTHKELTQYLTRKGIDESSIEKAIERLSQEKLVDDADYANRFAAERLRSQLKGRRLLQQELRMRGIGKETARSAIDLLDDEEELAMALRAASKKWPYIKGEPRDRKHKLMTFLMRRGFPGDIVKTAVSRVVSQPEDDDEWHMLDN